MARQRVKIRQEEQDESRINKEDREEPKRTTRRRASIVRVSEIKIVVVVRVCVGERAGVSVGVGAGVCVGIAVESENTEESR